MENLVGTGEKVPAADAAVGRRGCKHDLHERAAVSVRGKEGF